MQKNVKWFLRGIAATFSAVLLLLTYVLIKKYVLKDEATWRVYERGLGNDPVLRGTRDFATVRRIVDEKYSEELEEEVRFLNEAAKEEISRQFHTAFGGA